MRTDRLPLTYGECRARFLRACTEAGAQPESHPIEACGPDGAELTIDVVRFGADRPRRALAVLSGVHGVEAFLPSTLQTELVARLPSVPLPDDVAVLVVHAVNPWGMAWWRRQNEHNVDLNRNWRRSEGEAVHNEAYDEVHPLACPDGDELPSVDELLAAATAFVAERGMPWVRDAITAGQYRHRDGLHFGGDRTEESCRIVEDVVTRQLGGVQRLLTLDLHTGHGPRGAVTFLCDQPPHSDQHQFLATVFGPERVEATTGNPEASTGLKVGQIANGFADLLGDTTCFASSVEWGTADDLEQLAATYLESWMHRRGGSDHPDRAAVIWRYRECFSPDDPDWEQAGLRSGRALLADALDAVCAWETA